jgi:hypothetical protein
MSLHDSLSRVRSGRLVKIRIQNELQVLFTSQLSIAVRWSCLPLTSLVHPHHPRQM